MNDAIVFQIQSLKYYKLDALFYAVFRVFNMNPMKWQAGVVFGAIGVEQPGTPRAEEGERSSTSSEIRCLSVNM